MDSSHLSDLWNEFDKEWNKYLQIYQIRVHFLTQLNAHLDLEQNKHSRDIFRRLMEQHDLILNLSYDLNLSAYLNLAETLGYKDKYPLIFQRLKTYQENINTINTLQDLLDEKLNNFLNKIFNIGENLHDTDHSIIR